MVLKRTCIVFWHRKASIYNNKPKIIIFKAINLLYLEDACVKASNW